MSRGNWEGCISTTRQHCAELRLRSSDQAHTCGYQQCLSRRSEASCHSASHAYAAASSPLSPAPRAGTSSWQPRTPRTIGGAYVFDERTRVVSGMDLEGRYWPFTWVCLQKIRGRAPLLVLPLSSTPMRLGSVCLSSCWNEHGLPRPSPCF